MIHNVIKYNVHVYSVHVCVIHSIVLCYVVLEEFATLCLSTLAFWVPFCVSSLYISIVDFANEKPLIVIHILINSSSNFSELSWLIFPNSRHQ